VAEKETRDERIQKVLTSQCPDAIKQLVGLREWALGNNERIGKVLASHCGDAIRLLSNGELADYFISSGRKIPKSIRIGKERKAAIQKLIDAGHPSSIPTKTATVVRGDLRFVGAFGVDAGISGVYQKPLKRGKKRPQASTAEV
jgi:hypothetical protein